MQPLTRLLMVTALLASSGSGVMFEEADAVRRAREKAEDEARRRREREAEWERVNHEADAAPTLEQRQAMAHQAWKDTERVPSRQERRAKERREAKKARRR